MQAAPGLDQYLDILQYLRKHRKTSGKIDFRSTESDKICKQFRLESPGLEPQTLPCRRRSTDCAWRAFAAQIKGGFSMAIKVVCVKLPRVLRGVVKLFSGKKKVPQNP